LLRLELEETAFKIALKERHGRDWVRRRHDGRALPRAARLASEILLAWETALESFVWAEVGIDDVDADVLRLMGRYGLASYDAVHAATANVTGVGALVTTDAGFAHVPETELILYVDSSRVRSCRDRRAPTRRNR
jgi:predicted nucleic acid-binding protein